MIDLTNVKELALAIIAGLSLGWAVHSHSVADRMISTAGDIAAVARECHVEARADLERLELERVRLVGLSEAP